MPRKRKLALGEKDRETLETELGRLVAVTGRTTWDEYEEVMYEAGMMMAGIRPQEWVRVPERGIEVMRGGDGAGELEGEVLAMWVGSDEVECGADEQRLFVHSSFEEEVRMILEDVTKQKHRAHSSGGQTWLGGLFLPRYTKPRILEMVKRAMGWGNARVSTKTESGNELMEIKKNTGGEKMKICLYATGRVGIQGARTKDGQTNGGIVMRFRREWDDQLVKKGEEGGRVLEGIKRVCSGGVGGGDQRVNSFGRTVTSPAKSQERLLTQVEKDFLEQGWTSVVKSVEALTELRLVTGRIYFQKRGKADVLEELDTFMKSCGEYQREFLECWRRDGVEPGEVEFPEEGMEAAVALGCTEKVRWRRQGVRC